MFGLAGFGLLFLLLLGVGIYKVNRFYRALIADFCGITLHRILPSPNGKRALVSFDVDCGATTRFNTQLSLIPEGAYFSHKEYPAFFVIGGRHDVRLRWQSNDEVEIDVPRDEQVYRRESLVDGVAVTYK